MEEWTELRDDDDDGNAKGKVGLSFDLDFQIENYRFDSGNERLRSLFDQVLVAFMREKSAGKCIRPIPALCGDGRPVDLFKLFWVVRKIGGHETVSKKNLWGFVSEECGLGIGVIPSIKLIYMKYLNELEQWLRQASSKRVLEDGHSELVQKLDSLSWELETRSRDSIQQEQEQEKQEKDSMCVKDTKDGAKVAVDISESELHSSPSEGISGPVDDLIMDFFTEEDDKLHSRVDHNHLSASVKRVLEKDVSETNDFSKGQSGDDDGKSCIEDSDNIVGSAKKVIKKAINKVLNFGETTSAIDDDEKFSVQVNNDVCKSAKKVVKKVISKTHNLSKNIKDDDEKFSVQRSINITIPAGSDVGNVLDSRKRKRQVQSFAGMLNWLTHVAKHSDDPSVGSIPECSKWRDYGSEEFWVQALLVREALLIRRNANTNAGENFLKDQQKKPRMHPSMYEDDALDHQSTEKLRCSRRIPSSTKSHLCPCCNAREAPQSKDVTRQQAEVGNGPKTPPELLITDVEEPSTNSSDHKCSEAPVKKQVSVGPLFQAEVPEWTGVVSQSNPKWLGTRMWPPPDGANNSMVMLDPIGKGRLLHCDCLFPNSVECIRFHIAEKRLKLKCELGSLFYHWRFDRMGEEVSLSWTQEEEKRFKEMMRSYAAVPNKFWNYASKFLPTKKLEMLVSYYFNVFLIQRRSYQNRVTPKDVDSDDDEKECGSIGDSFGYKALRIPGLELISCTLNKESTELM